MLAFEEIALTLPDGYSAYARYYPVDAPKGAVLYLHGIQSHCGWYERSAFDLQQAGYALLLPDRRGSGHNAQQRGHADSHQQLVEDTHVATEDLIKRSGCNRIHLLGISWGGKLASVTFAEHPQNIQSLTLICPGLFPRVGVTNAQKFKIGLSMLSSPHRHYDIPLNDSRLFTSDPRWMAFIDNDEKTLRQATASFFLATRRMDRLVQSLKNKDQCVPIHLMLAEGDEIIDNDQTALFIRTLDWPVSKITEYEGTRHTFEFESIYDQYIKDLINWLDSIGKDRL